MLCCRGPSERLPRSVKTIITIGAALVKVLGKTGEGRNKGGKEKRQVRLVVVFVDRGV